MPTNPYAALLAAGLDPEPFVRRALRQFESEFREMALLALADWERQGLVAPELFAAVASLQRPSWGNWNGLLSALRTARKTVLRTRGAEERAKLDQAVTLKAILDALDRTLPSEMARALAPRGRWLGTDVGKKVKPERVFAGLIGLRNRAAHDAPDDPAWWRGAAEELAPLVGFYAAGQLAPPTAARDWPAPWFLAEGEEVWSFNGLAEDLAVHYVSRGGAARQEQASGPNVLLAFQRLLGKAEVREHDFRRLLARLAPEDLKGVLMGDYLVGPPVGEGGFARVHVGRQLSTGRKVAIKLLRDGMLEEDKQRFRQEAAYLSRFNHPHIVSVLDYGEEVWSAPRQFSLAGEPWYADFAKSAPVKTYMVLEWVDGPTLDEVFRRPARPPLRVLTEWFMQAANALQAVHANGLVHRDVKPSNLMVTAEGALKLMDFGIARNQGELKTILTATGRTLGTPAYMSPEQLRAAEGDAAVGPASDVYSLCATFYELFTGVRFFHHDTDTQASVRTRKLSGQAPERPRKHIHGLPWEVETILLGGLQAEAPDRYRSMAALERDLRRFLNNEPILYRRPSLLRRCQLGYRRNRPVAHLLGAFLLLAAAGVGWYVHSIRAEQNRRALAQVDALLRARPEEVRPILRNLEEARAEVLPRLRELRDRPDLPGPERQRVLLALLPVEPEHAQPLAAAMLVADPAETLLLRDGLAPHRAELTAALWGRVEDPRGDAAVRFRAAVALATFDPDGDRWRAAAGAVVEELLSANPLHLGLWTEALRPVRAHLLGALARAFRDPHKPAPRQVAATVLADYAAGDPEVLAELVKDADERQYPVVLPRLRAHPARAAALLQAELAKEAPPDAPPGAKDALAARQANAAVALLQMGREEAVWPLLRLGPDPRVRSYLIHRASPLGADPRTLLRRLAQETDVSTRRALLLALGEFRPDQLPADERAALTPGLLRRYANDPDPGVHGAAEWLLRAWQQRPRLREVDKALRSRDGKPVGRRRWYVNGEGHTLVVITGPVVFRMGSPPTEAHRGENETPHPKRIGRSFAIAAKKVTVEQFLRFRPKQPYSRRYSPRKDCPINTVTWYDAVAYCNWLSRQEGVPEAEWCYEPQQAAPGKLRPRPDYLRRTGYRLPTEAEREYACRAGTVTSRYYGEAEELLDRYAWFTRNAQDRCRPGATLKPNDLGLFDMLGNLHEWCQDTFRPYVPGEGGKPSEDQEDERLQQDDQSRRVLRGSSFSSRVATVRSARRNRHEPTNRDPHVGFRVARTQPPGRGAERRRGPGR